MENKENIQVEVRAKQDIPNETCIGELFCDEYSFLDEDFKPNGDFMRLLSKYKKLEVLQLPCKKIDEKDFKVSGWM